MIKKVTNLSVAIIFVILLISAGCATKTSSSEIYLGKWRYEVPDLPEDNTGILVISKEESGYSCIALTDGGYEQPFETFDIQDGKVTGSYESQGYEVTVDGIFEGNKLTGKVSAGGMEMTYSAVKEE